MLNVDFGIQTGSRSEHGQISKIFCFNSVLSVIKALKYVKVTKSKGLLLTVEASSLMPMALISTCFRHQKIVSLSSVFKVVFNETLVLLVR